MKKLLLASLLIGLIGCKKEEPKITGYVCDTITDYYEQGEYWKTVISCCQMSNYDFVSDTTYRKEAPAITSKSYSRCRPQFD